MRATLVIVAVLLCLGSAMAKPAQSGQSCSMCQFIASYAEDYLESNATETQVINFVAQVCNLFPSGFKQQVGPISISGDRTVFPLLSTNCLLIGNILLIYHR